MHFPISDQVFDPWLLGALGFAIGVLGGFFGVGGSFLAGPALFSMGMPMHMVVGTDLAHITGKSVVAARRHRALGNVDLKLGCLMAVGTIAGVELGAQLIEVLKQRHNVDMVVGPFFVLVLLSISAFVGWESLRALRRKERGEREQVEGRLAAWVQRLRFGPQVDLPVSGVQVPLWVILATSLAAGLFAGFLGGGAGYLRMPMLVYVLGVPTHVAVGTDLFEVILSAGYGTLTHGLKGNVDVLVALVMHTGGALGAQFGAGLTDLFSGPRLRLAFVGLPILGAGLMIYKLMTGGGTP